MNTTNTTKPFSSVMIGKSEDSTQDNHFWFEMRRSILAQLQTIEHRLKIHPTTKEIREAYKKQNLT